MTYAPADLLAVRRYLLQKTGLPGDAVGIVHGSPQGGGYHEGNDLLARAGRRDSDYSKRESPRDRPGTDAASAVDIGDFRLPDGRTQRDLAQFVIDRARAGDPRAGDIREVIRTAPGATSVSRYDRLGIRSTGDSSHLTHGHFSFFRDSEGRRDDPDNFLGLLVEFFEGGDDMGRADDVLGNTIQVDNAIYSLFMRLVTGTDPYWEKLVPGAKFNDPVLARSSLRALRDAIDATAAADEARDRTALTAIQGLTAAIQAGGGSIDAAPIVAAIQAAKAETVSVVQQLQQQLAASEAREAERDRENDELKARLAEALAG